MRIALIVRHFPVLSQTFILNQITGLIDRNHQVDIYPLEGIPAQNLEKVHPDVEKYHLLDRTYPLPKISSNYAVRWLNGVKLFATNFFKNPAVVWRSLNVFKYGTPAATFWLLHVALPTLDKEPYDIIHCQFGDLGLRGISFRDICFPSAKLVTTFRGFDISLYLREHGDRVYEPLFQQGEFFMTNCDYFKRELIRIGCDPNRLAVVRSGLEPRDFTFSPPRPPTDGKICIATTGRLSEKKGIEYGIRAVAQLLPEYPNLTYKIIGDGPLKAELKQLIAQLGVQNSVQLLGWKTQPEIQEILTKSHLFMAPSVTAADGDCDAPINVLKEAMAMGLPVISTYHGGIPELVRDGISGFLVPERDAEGLAEKIKFLIEHPECWKELGQAGRREVEMHYNINPLNDRLVDIYQQALNAPCTAQSPHTSELIPIQNE
ncbi:glycosyltransferase [Laspinema olomoucense]|uniref:glycosyltransferase n=1 Tax=Laspinema olomoucense TaxID=3231600 RepID=UPI0021BA9554|nr:glycosyltransferase [Laspinema sp. D3c]MCT7992880.1 glycosyltransferase [Laspinema sp. D3c]